MRTNKLLFNPIDLRFRAPIGGVEVALPCRFYVRIPSSENPFGVHLEITSETRAKFNVFMEKTDEEDGLCGFTTTFTPVETGLYFYAFSYWNGEKTRYVSKSNINLGETCDFSRPFQLTVCDKQESAPSKKRGIIYQIMPDRFRRSGEIKVREGGVYHENWNDTPVYLPNKEGEILNNDFFGGNFSGVIEKLDYLESLSVSIIYFNPIFEAQSNHRYDTGDFEKIDECLGGEEAFRKLVALCKERGIEIILDGVFNHVGVDSKYFNKSGLYDTIGAYQSKASPYAEWFSFKKFPDDYRCWWDIKLLPAISENCKSYESYIISVIKKYMDMGILGFRLDVVDELPDEFLAKITETVKSYGTDKLVIGEVWEDASSKVAYGKRRKYFTKRRLDSVMNYPWKNAIIDFLKSGNKKRLYLILSELYNNYPKSAIDLNMNLLSTHDSARAITALSLSGYEKKTRKQLGNTVMTSLEYERGKKLLKLAALIEYTLPGIPSLYYGDEAGLTGFNDPFNRRTYPWGEEDNELILWYRMLGGLRKNEVFSGGGFALIDRGENALCFTRELNGKKLEIIVNMADSPLSVDAGFDLVTKSEKTTVESQTAAVMER